MSLLLSKALVESLRADAASFGFARLGLARLDDPRLVRSRRALERYAAEGRAGEMDFMTKTITLRQHPEELLPDGRTAIVGLVAYDGEPSSVARYAQFFDYHTDVHRRLLDVAAVLEREVPGIATLVCVDTKPVPERALATIAGLGFIGKNGCLIAPRLGSFVVIGVLLTNAAFEDDARAEVSNRETVEGSVAKTVATREESTMASERTSGERGSAEIEVPEEAPWEACGRCRACLDACPTDAFDAPGVLDPRRCISYLTIEHRSAVPEVLLDRVGERVAGCDVCQDVCPYNRGAASRLPLTLVRDSGTPVEAPAEDGEGIETLAITEVAGPRLGRTARSLPAPRSREVVKLRPHEDGRTIPTLAQLATIRNRRYKAFVKHSPVDRIPRKTMHRNAVIALGNREGALQDDERRALAWHLLGSDEAMYELAARAWTRREGNEPPERAELAARFSDLAFERQQTTDGPSS